VVAVGSMRPLEEEVREGIVNVEEVAAVRTDHMEQLVVLQIKT
jgi:hypothetical protein